MQKGRGVDQSGLRDGGADGRLGERGGYQHLTCHVTRSHGFEGTLIPDRAAVHRQLFGEVGQVAPYRAVGIGSLDDSPGERAHGLEGLQRNTLHFRFHRYQRRQARATVDHEGERAERPVARQQQHVLRQAADQRVEVLLLHRLLRSRPPDKILHHLNLLLVNAHRAATLPPSTRSGVPVTKLASSLAR